ncbi:hypothetical protein N658DRAFT_276060 [Parathielavia hyrcaniae]|uniref:Uncharacterized protein n=1 Tax=Parathielavia hyrcaniae TaxID=113614 RepID=A0AAN6T386_9PEZI|nr:hypothetical protein N658DRAFT_276060 [Parathielavia hyrcaniae]
MFATRQAITEIGRYCIGLRDTVAGYTLAGVIITLLVLAVIAVAVPLAIIGCITTLFAWGFILVHTTVVYIYGSIMVTYNVLFTKPKRLYPRLGPADRGCPPTYAEWCAIIDAGPYYYPSRPFPRLPDPLIASNGDHDASAKSGKPRVSFLRVPDESSPRRRRKNTCVIIPPPLPSRPGRQPSDLEITAYKASLRIQKDYGFTVSPDESVCDENGELRDIGFFGRSWELRSAYSRRPDHYMAWWEDPTRIAKTKTRRGRTRWRDTSNGRGRRRRG